MNDEKVDKTSSGVSGATRLTLEQIKKLKGASNLSKLAADQARESTGSANER